ncbi:MAG: transglycosylase SLT domain-containing protein [Deltaproteobacteria bacterium]|nr:transglycosylase SLT domain-containing protein [Deltaproteobacteria bacterium]
MGSSEESSCRPARFAIGWVAAWWVLLPLLAFAAPEDFPKPAGLVPQVEFWKKVFAEYSENQVAIHDNLYLDKIYAVIDLRPLAESGAGEETLRRERRRRQQAELNAVDRALARLARGGFAADDLDERERAIRSLFQDVPGARKFSAARGRVRAQQGLRERFRRGLEISRRYLPRMEEIFRREALPVELTRLPFVESSFNVNAYSKVGAAGIWQFIPSSARIYLQLNSVEDSRRDPIYATMGAARHLRDDYEVLGNWPLAVTAYNHGRAGMARAVRKLGTKDLMTIIRGYDGRSFGFASRNFYAEFLAAVEVERDHEKYFGEVQFEPRIEYQEVQIQDYLRFATLAKMARCSVEELRVLNPGFSNEVVEGKLFVPRNYTLRIPAGRLDEFRAAYASLPAADRFGRQQRTYLVHRVTRGQTVGAIAKRYRTTVAAIQAANGLRDLRRVRVGQVLKIPTG